MARQIEMRVLWRGELFPPSMPEMPAGSQIVYIDVDTGEIVDAPLGATAEKIDEPREEQ